MAKPSTAEIAAIHSLKGKPYGEVPAAIAACLIASGYADRANVSPQLTGGNVPVYLTTKGRSFSDSGQTDTPAADDIVPPAPIPPTEPTL